MKLPVPPCAKALAVPVAVPKHSASVTTTESIKTESRIKMLGCLSHLPQCELVEYYLQVYIYQYILSTEYGLPVKASRIFQIKFVYIL